MKFNNGIAPKVLSIALLLISSLATIAQKLPNVQTASVLAPADIKVDGKPIEWNNKFQALNHATGIYYTVANDAENLYLVVQGTDAHTVQKILSGGVTFTVKSADRKSNATPPAITYPIIPPADRRAIVNAVKVKSDEAPFNQDDINKQFSVASKQIEVFGLTGIQDTLISVYNDFGITAVARFDSNRALTYELSIPLKHLQQSLDNATLNYNIKLNPPRITARPAGMPKVVVVSTMAIGSSGDIEFQDLMATTDFSGTYTLAKK
jgi:hypothetical protein